MYLFRFFFILEFFLSYFFYFWLLSFYLFLLQLSFTLYFSFFKRLYKNLIKLHCEETQIKTYMLLHHYYFALWYLGLGLQVQGGDGLVSMLLVEVWSKGVGSGECGELVDWVVDSVGHKKTFAGVSNDGKLRVVKMLRWNRVRWGCVEGVGKLGWQLGWGHMERVRKLDWLMGWGVGGVWSRFQRGYGCDL